VCAVDSKPRRWRQEDLDALEAVAAAVVAEIEVRLANAQGFGFETERGALNIAALSHRTGVATDTLRKWEQRYGILAPMRTRGGQRRYTERDVERVEWLKARLAQGYRIGEAAALLGRDDEGVAHTPEDHRRMILDAVDRADAKVLARALDQAFALHGVDEFIADVVEPVLVEVGDRWAAGTFSVAQEHLASEAIRGRLAHLLADTRGGVRGVAVLACAPGERHDLGLLMVAILMRVDGWEVVYLGADTPLRDAVSLAERLHADVLGLSVGTTEGMSGLEQAWSSKLRVVIGGRAANAHDAKRVGARHVDGGVVESVRALRRVAA
jgi:methanogenic corrinoid protein MtbC1